MSMTPSMTQSMVTPHVNKRRKSDMNKKNAFLDDLDFLDNKNEPKIDLSVSTKQVRMPEPLTP